MKKPTALLIGFLFAVVIGLQLYTLSRLSAMQNNIDGLTMDSGDLIDHMKAQQGIRVLSK